MFLLDTNIISELIKREPNSYVLKRMEDVPDTSLYKASVCAMELRYTFLASLVCTLKTGVYPNKPSQKLAAGIGYSESPLCSGRPVEFQRTTQPGLILSYLSDGSPSFALAEAPTSEALWLRASPAWRAPWFWLKLCFTDLSYANIQLTS
jgi:hypothetical protein